MNAAVSPPSRAGRPVSLALLTVLLGLEAAAALGTAVFLSMLAPLAGEGGVGLQFAAGGLVVFAIAAYIAARKAHRRRASTHTYAAILQVLVVVAVFAATVAGGWAPAFLIGLGLAGAVLVVLSLPSLSESLTA